MSWVAKAYGTDALVLLEMILLRMKTLCVS